MSALVLREQVVHFEVLGRGRPLIFLHGWVGSWRYWIPAMQAASISFRAYALDFLGFGDSARAPGLYSLEHQASLLEALMNSLGIRKAALLGHGLGAIVGLCFAARQPQRIDRLLAISLPLEPAAVNPRLRSTPAPELADWLLARNPNAIAIRSEAPKTEPSAVQASIDALEGLNMTGLIASLKTPTLLVHGVNDPAIAMPRPESLAQLPSGAHQLTFEESGHFPMLDEPHKFNRLVADFLSLTSGQSPRQLQVKEEWRRRVR